MEYESVKTEENLIREVCYPLYKGKGWLKFYGIVTIIAGILSALSIVGILYAWLPIWLGVLINGAANKMDTAYNTGNKQAFLDAQQKLTTFFVINSVLILISFIFIILFFVAFWAGEFSGLLNHLQDSVVY